MRKKALRLGQKLMLPASNMNHQLVPYIIVGHEKGCVYHLVAESRFVEPYKRTIVKAVHTKTSNTSNTSAAA